MPSNGKVTATQKTTIHPEIVPSSQYFTGEPREYVINCILPKQAITLVTAPPGAGKTKFALSAARAVACGTAFLDQYAEQGKICYFNLDRMFRGDLEARLVDLSKDDELGPWTKDLFFVEDDTNLLGNVTYTDSEGVSRALEDKKTGDHVKMVDYLITSLQNFSLIVFDTWHRLCVNASMSEDSSDDTDALMIPMRRIANETGAAVLILHHTPKHNPNDVRGSSAITASVDHVLNIEGKAVGEGKLTCIKTRTDKIHIFPIQFREGLFELNFIEGAELGKPIKGSMWESLITQDQKQMTEQERKMQKYYRQFEIRMRKFGETIALGEYGMHRVTLMDSAYRGKKSLLDQVLDHFRKVGRLKTKQKGNNPFYVLLI